MLQSGPGIQTRREANTLDKLPAGEGGRIKEIAPETEHYQRLLQIGFLPGSEVSVIRNLRGGPMVVEVLGNRQILGHEIARGITIG